MTRTTLIKICMTLIVVSWCLLGITVHSTEISLETTPSLHLQIGIITFHTIPRRSRELSSFLFRRTFDIDNLCSAFNTTLINGKGRFPGGPSDVPLAIVNVKQGTRLVLAQVFRV